MSVNKRKQTKALQSMLLKLPLTNLAGGLLILFLGYEAFGLGEGIMALLYGLVGAVV